MKRTGMPFAPGIRSVRFTGFSVALMLLSTCSCSDHPVIKVNAMVGEAAALPCMCPPDWPPYLVWQKSIDDQALVVNYYKDDDQEDNQMALEYRNRTELRLTGNCSLVIHIVCSSDQGLYICYYKKKPLRHEKIYLEVTAQQVQGKESAEPQSVQSTIVISSVCGSLVILITIAAAYVGITCRNRHQIRRTFIATSMRSL
ncbi:myelin-oligodendrocyte glycoprotein-like isoform X1 [Sinocyclocheilus anshuiensis]|uniref:myelin-oligodendrocyte glycoprotein-like isoform X1 n=1 Tax=Sinocyclocheilus anshuiensis TaxID=1608454 RepID=UPI0007B8FA33|nr:PREDICTED: myelin-oligodendrocyte glycoprotein-like isoform X1 [Sinocyclocheilus anshuiensis]